MNISLIAITFLAAELSLPGQLYAFECNVCHSKNPRMVDMHKAVKGQTCFGCHKVGDKLMGQGQPKDLDSLLKRRATDSDCLPCHGNHGKP